MASLATIQGWSEVPAIAHFCSLFRGALDLLEFEIEELEAALVGAAGAEEEELFSGSLLERLAVRLLRPCLPAALAQGVHEGNFSTYLRQLLESRREEAEEEGRLYEFRDPFQGPGQARDFAQLSCRDQVRTLHHLTSMRLEAPDVPERLKDLDPDGMRVEPLGEDSDGVTYWYFYGVRLYKEVGKAKPKKPRKKKEEPKEGEKSPETQGKKAKKAKEDEEVEEEEVAREAPGWYVACSTEAQWQELAARYKKSKRKQDREVYEVLRENFMPEIAKMFQEKEKEERIRLMMLNKRSSGRLDRKRAEKEKEFEERRREEEKRELELRAEEEKRRRMEKENKLKRRGSWS